jgi:hypothetical protein
MSSVPNRRTHQFITTEECIGEPVFYKSARELEYAEFLASDIM